MSRYAVEQRTVSDAVDGGRLLVVAQWEAKEGQADNVADILSRFLPEAQREPGAQLFLISRGKENPGQFLFYELFRDEAAFSAHQETSHFETYIQGQACRYSRSANARSTHCCRLLPAHLAQARWAAITAGERRVQGHPFPRSSDNKRP